jgi:hypothetical protein
MRNAQINFAPEPLRYLGSLEAAQELPNAELLLSSDLIADIAYVCAVGQRSCLIHELPKDLRSNWRVLYGRQAPDMEVAKMMQFTLCMLLKAIGLEFLQ